MLMKKGHHAEWSTNFFVVGKWSLKEIFYTDMQPAMENMMQLLLP
jgi:hypothetical protein